MNVQCGYINISTVVYSVVVIVKKYGKGITYVASEAALATLVAADAIVLPLLMDRI